MAMNASAAEPGVYVPLRRPGEVIFFGVRRTTGNEVFRVDDAGPVALNPRTDLWNHSPTGFEWGYAGSGPAQLALALCCQVVADHQALRIYQTFKRTFIAKIETAQWRLPEQYLRNAVLYCLGVELALKPGDPYPDPDPFHGAPEGE